MNVEHVRGTRRIMGIAVALAAAAIAAETTAGAGTMADEIRREWRGRLPAAASEIQVEETVGGIVLSGSVDLLPSCRRRS